MHLLKGRNGSHLFWQEQSFLNIRIALGMLTEVSSVKLVIILVLLEPQEFWVSSFSVGQNHPPGVIVKPRLLGSSSGHSDCRYREGPKDLYF